MVIASASRQVSTYRLNAHKHTCCLRLIYMLYSVVYYVLDLWLEGQRGRHIQANARGHGGCEHDALHICTLGAGWASAHHGIEDRCNIGKDRIFAERQLASRNMQERGAINLELHATSFDIANGSGEIKGNGASFGAGHQTTRS